MGLHKILKIVAAVLSLAGLASLVMILTKGDEAIELAALNGDTSAVDPIAYVAYAVMIIILVFVVLFVLKNLFSDGATLKKTLINVGIFLLLFLVAYFVFAKGVVTELTDGTMLSEGGSKLIGAGLYLFYFLVIIASVLMLYTGVSKMLKR